MTRKSIKWLSIFFLQTQRRAAGLALLRLLVPALLPVPLLPPLPAAEPRPRPRAGEVPQPRPRPRAARLARLTHRYGEERVLSEVASQISIKEE